MKLTTPGAILGFTIMAAAVSCSNNKTGTSSSSVTDSTTIQTSEDKNKDHTYSPNQYASDSTVTHRDTLSGDASNTYPSNQYSSDSNVIKK